MAPPNHPRRPRPAILVAAGVLLLAALASIPSAQAFRGDGELALHDDADGPATLDVADCSFFVRGEGVTLAEGTVDVYRSHGRGGVEFDQSVAFTTEDGAFLVGPITVAGPMRLYIEVVYEGERTEHGDPELWISTSGEAHCGEPFVGCVEDPVAMALDDGSVRLEWGAAPHAERYFVSRTDGTQLPNGQYDWTSLGNTTGTSFVDTTAQPGETYIYEITGMNEHVWASPRCPHVQVTAVPFFGGPLLTALSLAGALGAMLALRRR